MAVAVHARIPSKDAEFLEKLVKNGHYSNISDALREGAKLLIRKHKDAGEAHHTTVWRDCVRESHGDLNEASRKYHERVFAKESGVLH